MYRRWQREREKNACNCRQLEKGWFLLCSTEAAPLGTPELLGPIPTPDLTLTLEVAPNQLGVVKRGCTAVFVDCITR